MNTETTESIIRAVTLHKDRLCWHTKKQQFFLEVSAGQWLGLTDNYLRTHLYHLGFFDCVTGDLSKEEKQKHPDKKDPAFAAAFSELLNTVQIEQSVGWSGKIAGFWPGIITQGNEKFLITGAPGLIDPKEGDCEFTLQYITELLPGIQADYFWAWLRHGYLSLKEQKRSFGQVMIIAGTSGDGKSLLQKRVITPILGGRSADASHWIGGGTNFNADLTKAEHWMVDDSGEWAKFSRRQAGDRIKKLAADPVVRSEAKGEDANYFVPFRRVSIVLNTEGRNIALLPELTADIKGKVTILRSSPATLPDQPLIEPRLEIEMPAVLYWLLETFEAANGVMGDKRFGTNPYHEESLVRELQESGHAAELRDLMESYAHRDNIKSLTGTATQWWKILSESSSSTLRTITHSPRELGYLLSELCRFDSEFISKRILHGRSTYQFTPMGGVPLTPIIEKRPLCDFDFT